jgi:hypothetical protein
MAFFGDYADLDFAPYRAFGQTTNSGLALRIAHARHGMMRGTVSPLNALRTDQAVNFDRNRTVKSS